VDNYERETREKRYVEGEKLLFDVSKHLTTLCTGSILVMIALLEKLFKENVRWKPLVLISFAAFIFSIMYAVNTMSGIGIALRQSESGGNAKTVNMLIQFTTFAIGLLCFMIFALKNL
jgi:hypothetical protein